MRFPDEYNDKEEGGENTSYVIAWMIWLSRPDSKIDMGYDKDAVLIDLTNPQDTHDFTFMLNREKL